MQVRLFKPRVREEAIAAAAEVMRSGWLGMGPKVAGFEQAFGAFVGAGFPVAVNTCTSALHLAVKLLNLEKGREVITTPATFVSTNEVLLWEGLVPVFADVDRRTGNLTGETIAGKISPRTGAVMLMHMAGYACDLEEIGALAAERGLAVVEDCAHACGARYRGQRVGASGNLGAFSFDPIKNLTTGDGGMLMVRTAAEMERARRLRYMGVSKDALTRVQDVGRAARPWEYDVPEVGYRYHMGDIAGAMGMVGLRYVDEENSRRREIAAGYRRRLEDVPGITLPTYEGDRECSYHLMVVLAENRDGLAKKLGQRGVITGVHYSRNDAYEIFSRAELPGAEWFCSRVLSLPMHLELDEGQIDYVCDVIREGW